MRKLTLFLTIAFVLTCVSGLLAQTNTGVVSVESITGLAPTSFVPLPDHALKAGASHTVSIKYDLTGLESVGKAGKWVVGNGWEVYSPEGADWVSFVAADGPFIDALPGDDSFTRYHKYYLSANDGGSWAATAWIPPAPDDAPYWTVEPGGNPTAGTDPNHSRVGYSLGSFSTSAGLIGNTSGIAARFTFQTLVSDAGKTMCIDSAKALAGWEWAPLTGTADRPKWDSDPWTAGEQQGPMCLEIFFVPNIPPEWCNGTEGSVEFNHCDEGSFTLCATDGGDGPGPMSYKFASGYETGYGEINGDEWTWLGSTVPQHDMLNILFLANDGSSDSEVPFTLHVTTTNRAPTITCPPTGKTLGLDKCDSLKFTAGDPDVCDLPLTVTPSVASGPNLEPAGTYEVRGSYLVFCPTTDGDVGDWSFTVTAFDGELEAECQLRFTAIKGAPYQVELEKKPEQYQGIFTDLFIKLYGVDPNEGLGGFDFLVAYDASALAFQLAYEGDIYNQDTEDPAGCGWEYFTYRFGPYGNCGNACPSGMLRVIGLAETNNGPYHPDCLTTPYYPETFPVTLAYLRFLVSNDRTLECTYVPVRFFWYNCGDNTLSNAAGSLLMLSDAVYDFVDYGSAFIGTSIAATEGVVFPTYLGAQEECICEPYDELRQTGDPTCKVAARRYVDFQNGGVDIACADSIDARGDINLNGLGYEIADAVMFTNYFIQGLSAFGSHIEGSIAASDTNADGLALTVADLVYLIRVVIGDAVPYAKAIPAAANVTYGNGTFSVDTEMGAAYIVMAGNATPTLLASNMEMKSGMVDGNMHILVFSLEGNSFSGNFLHVNGGVISTEFATAEGHPVVAKVMPSDFALHQNYPNPFNPTTKIRIEIPKAGLDYTLNIYNVTGQLVETISGKSTGYDEVVWDASGNASGIYFYKLTAGDYSATKKAVLLK